MPMAKTGMPYPSACLVMALLLAGPIHAVLIKSSDTSATNLGEGNGRLLTTGPVLDKATAAGKIVSGIKMNEAKDSVLYKAADEFMDKLSALKREMRKDGADPEKVVNNGESANVDSVGVIVQRALNYGKLSKMGEKFIEKVAKEAEWNSRTSAKQNLRAGEKELSDAKKAQEGGRVRATLLNAKAKKAEDSEDNAAIPDIQRQKIALDAELNRIATRKMEAETKIRENKRAAGFADVDGFFVSLEERTMKTEVERATRRVRKEVPENVRAQLHKLAAYKAKPGTNLARALTALKIRLSMDREGAKFEIDESKLTKPNDAASMSSDGRRRTLRSIVARMARRLGNALGLK